MSDYLVVLVTATDKTQAKEIARLCLEDKLAACVNLVPVESLFVWEGQLEEAEEVLMIIKTRVAVFDQLMTTIKAAHSYTTPEIISLPITRGSQAYLNWIDDETRPATND